MFVCPTSEFPICPSGNPTAAPLASICATGHIFLSLSKFGFFAKFTAFPSSFEFSPNPSNIINIVNLLSIFLPSNYLYLSKFTISTNDLASSDAPPTKPPSMSFIANNSLAFEPLTLPPYKIDISSVLNNDFIFSLIALIAF